MQPLQPPGRLLIGRGRHPQARHGQEEAGGNGQAARALRLRRARPKVSRKRKSKKSSTRWRKFAGYGFNKSHSAAYAYLAYVVAYLKTHYPVEFMSALLTSEMGSTDKVVKYINECREIGIAVHPPDVNSSGRDFSPRRAGDSNGPVRHPAMSAPGRPTRRHRSARRAAVPFKSLYDLCERVELGQRQQADS